MPALAPPRQQEAGPKDKRRDLWQIAPLAAMFECLIRNLRFGLFGPSPLPRPATQNIPFRWVAGRGSGLVPNRNSLFREFRIRL